MNLFKDLRDSGHFSETYLNNECLKFCFLPVLRQGIVFGNRTVEQS